MAIALWSGNLRLSLVLVPVNLFPAVSTEGQISFRMIHEPSGKPIKYVKGIETERGFEEVPDEEIIKGHHVLLKSEEIDELKLEAKHTIDMTRFVDRDEIDSRYFEKPYYLMPDGNEADEGYTVLRDALAQTKKVSIGQLVMGGREHLVGITSQGRGLALFILRYADELRKPEPYFDKIESQPAADAMKLAVDLVNQQSGKFEPQKMPNEYARAVHELVQAKIEQCAPELELETAKGESPKVINIMDALKKSMQSKGTAKVRDAVRKRTGKRPHATDIANSHAKSKNGALTDKQCSSRWAFTYR